MKKSLRNVLIMATAVLLVTALAGCQKNVPAAGEWTDEDGTITAELQELFDKATETLTGVSYKPVRLVGKQQVEGWNYKFLCEETTVTSSVKHGFRAVIVIAVRPVIVSDYLIS